MKPIASLIDTERAKMRARLVTPHDIDAARITICEFTENKVKAIVPEDVKCGVYLIGVRMLRAEEGGTRVYSEFRVCYFGRSVKGLQQRICDHLAKGGNPDELHVYDGSLYFAVWECDSEEEAYKEECRYFDIFLSDTDVRREGNGYYNDFKYSHDTKNSMPFPASNAVYVDNK